MQKSINLYNIVNGKYRAVIEYIEALDSENLSVKERFRFEKIRRAALLLALKGRTSDALDMVGYDPRGGKPEIYAAAKEEQRA
jgi:hypothetical protein